MEKIVIIYGSSSGNTESAAKTISSKFDSGMVDLCDVSKVAVGDLAKYSNLILGTSTWGIGDLQDDWEGFIVKLKEADLTGKKVALFGLGDSDSYADSFVDGMGIIYEAIKDKGCEIIGQVAVDDYSFVESQAVVDNRFVGLPLDEDNECNLSEDRINNWVNQLKPAFN
ncbi:flavodoxin [Marinilabiliaceae bacterium JC017]|nr:flavodoxin [Marinilabiliaceae bacterium JC017]